MLGLVRLRGPSIHRTASWRAATRHGAGAFCACLLSAAVLAACGSGGLGASSATHGSDNGGEPVGAAATTAEATPGATSFAQAALSVPAGNAAEPFNVTRRLRIPAGWHAEVWARVPEARFMAWTPEGDLLLSASDSGRIVELVPHGGFAGRPKQVLLAAGLSLPSGMAFDRIDGATYLYVAQSDQLDRYRWQPGGTLGAMTVIAGGLPDTGPEGEDTHRLKSLAIGPDHRLYVSIGSVSNARTPNPHQYPPRASIVSLNLGGGGLRVIARGVRNGEGLAFAPDGSLWTAVNERDEVPYPYHRSYGGVSEAFGKVIRSYVNEHPPDELARLVIGHSNLGWPFCNPNPDDVPGQPEKGLHYEDLPYVADAITNPHEEALDCKTLAPLTRGLPAHSAPLGLVFLQGSAVRAPYDGGAVLAVHGSWDRTPPRSPGVLWLPFKEGLLGAPETLIGGFQLADGERWGRPVDAVPGPEGDLFVSDDIAGAVYRIGPAGP
jgi:glucose/arabinose dehydrogenase